MFASRSRCFCIILHTPWSRLSAGYCRHSAGISSKSGEGTIYVWFREQRAPGNWWRVQTCESVQDMSAQTLEIMLKRRPCSVLGKYVIIPCLCVGLLSASCHECPPDGAVSQHFLIWSRPLINTLLSTLWFIFFFFAAAAAAVESQYLLGILFYLTPLDSLLFYSIRCILQLHYNQIFH